MSKYHLMSSYTCYWQKVNHYSFSPFGFSVETGVTTPNKVKSDTCQLQRLVRLTTIQHNGQTGLKSNICTQQGERFIRKHRQLSAIKASLQPDGLTYTGLDRAMSPSHKWIKYSASNTEEWMKLARSNDMGHVLF